MITYQEVRLDALGDGTRRAILTRLLDGPMAVGEIARDFPITRPAVSQHLRVLKTAKLVLDRPDGNRRLYELNPEAFESLRDYFDRFWTHALAAFKAKVEAQDQSGSGASQGFMKRTTEEGNDDDHGE